MLVHELGMFIRMSSKYLLTLGSLSSHRHPDHDLCSNSWDEVDGVADDNFHVGGAVATGGGGVLKEATNDRSSYYHDHNLCEQKGCYLSKLITSRMSMPLN